MQEKFWGYRYIMKSFQDLYKFGNSADLGISAAYKFNDWLSADAIIVNGEGYKKIQKNDGLQYGLGATIKPIKGLSMRVYYGLNECTDHIQKNIQNLATFIGYKGKCFSLGAEYNRIRNAQYSDGNDMNGFSVYGNLQLNKEGLPEAAIISVLASNVIMNNNRTAQDVIGPLSALNTQTKSNLVDAINEIGEQSSQNKKNLITVLESYGVNGLTENSTFSEIIQEIQELLSKNQNISGTSGGLYDTVDYKNIFFSNYGKTTFEDAGG
jgi:hypothetical protein